MLNRALSAFCIGSYSIINKGYCSGPNEFLFPKKVRPAETFLEKIPELAYSVAGRTGSTVTVASETW